MARTQIHGTNQVQSGTIALDRLVENVIQADGGQAFTADQSHGGFKLTNLGNGISASDAVNKSQLDAAVQGYDWKQSVRVATTTNGALSTVYENGDVVDGITLVTGDRILLKDQTTGSENGIYTVNASGAPTRAIDADSSAKVTAGMALSVAQGTANGNTSWLLITDDPIVLATTALVFTQMSGASGGVTNVSVVSANGFGGSVANAGTTPAITISTSVNGLVKGNGTALSAAAAGTDYYAPAGTDIPITDGGTGVSTLPSGLLKGAGTSAITAAAAGTDYLAPSNYVANEVLGGTPNGVTTAFTLATAPIAGTQSIYHNGVLQRPGAGFDYTISGLNITWVASPPPETGAWLSASYFK